MNIQQGQQEGQPLSFQVELELAQKSITKYSEALHRAIQYLPPASSHGFHLHRKNKKVDTTYLPLASITEDTTVVIEIECKSEDFMKHLQKHSKKGHLASILKSFSHEPRFVWNPTLRLASGSDSLSPAMAMSSDGFVCRPESIMGTRALLVSRREGGKTKRRGGIAVVGGVIVVNNTLYGLSVGHYNVGLQPRLDEHPMSEEPKTSKLKRIRSFVSAKDGGGTKTKPEPEDSQYLMTGTVVESRFLSEEHPTRFHDWALVELTLDVPHQNSLRSRLSREVSGHDATDIVVSDIFSEHIFSESNEIRYPASLGCFVVTKQAVIPGKVSAGSTRISLASKSSHNALAEVLVVRLKDILPRGSSGSWVIIDGKLLGTVIAGADGPPRAFVAPIEDTFKSIKEHLHATRVCLPSRVDTGIFKLQRLQQQSRWLRRDEVGTSDDGADLLELELLLAQRQSELRECDSRRSVPSMGWFGVSRQEVLEQSATFLNPRSFSDSRVGAELSGNTIKSLLLLGHIFPVVPRFRLAHLIPTMINGDVSLQILATEAGENVFELIFLLSMVLHCTVDYQTRHTDWIQDFLTSLMRLMEFPLSLFPSARQLLLLVKEILGGPENPSLGGVKFDIEHSDGRYEQISIYDEFTRYMGMGDVGFPKRPSYFLLEDMTRGDLKGRHTRPLRPEPMSRLLLQLSDVAHSKGSTVLVCAGGQEVLIVGWIASLLFGLTTERRKLFRGKWRTPFLPISEPSSRDPDVYVFFGQGIEISEVLDRKSLSQF